MAEVIGLVASVVQLAGAGLKLSETLYHYVDGVATADRRIRDIANEVKLTSSVIKELGAIFEKNDTANLISENAVKTANETFKECFAVFTELDLKINRGKPGKTDKIGKMSRLMLPFKENKIELLRSQIEKLKSTLQLLMQVLIHAHQVSSEKYSREAEAKHREEIKQLLENKKQATKRYEESLRNFIISDGSTAVDDGDRSIQDEDDVGSSSNLFNAAGVMGSTINPNTIATCVDHVRSLLADIETLQLALARQVNGDDHSDHHQKAIGSYFLARSHLDSVLLGKSQANVTDAKIRQSICEASGGDIASAVANVTPPDRHALAALRDEEARKEMKVKMEMEMEMERARIVAEARKKSADVSINDKDREAALMIEREVRLEREARDQVRAKKERERRAHGSVHRPASRSDSIENIPLEFPPVADYRRTKYREEYASSRRTSSEDRGLRKTIEGRAALDQKPQFQSESLHAGGTRHRSISPAKAAKKEALVRGERLWQEELRRREGISSFARDDVSPQRGLRVPAILQPSKPARYTSRSSSASYQLEERRPSISIIDVDATTSPPEKGHDVTNVVDAPTVGYFNQRYRPTSRESSPDSIESPPRLDDPNNSNSCSFMDFADHSREYLAEASSTSLKPRDDDDRERKHRRRKHRSDRGSTYCGSDNEDMRSTVSSSSRREKKSMYRDAEPALRKSRPYSLERGSRPTSMISESPRPSRRKSNDEVKDFGESAGPGEIIGGVTINHYQSRLCSPRGHSNEDAGIIRPSKRVQEKDRTKKREEKMLDEWGLKPRREGLEVARRNMKGKTPKKPTGMNEKKQGRIIVRNSAGAISSYPLSEMKFDDMPSAVVVDEVDELLRDWTTVLG